MSYVNEMLEFAQEIATAANKDETSTITFEVQKVVDKNYGENNLMVQVTVFDEDFDYLDSFVSPRVYAHIQPVLNEINMTKMILIQELGVSNFLNDVGVVTFTEKQDDDNSYDVINHGILCEDCATAPAVYSLFEENDLQTDTPKLHLVH